MTGVLRAFIPFRNSLDSAVFHTENGIVKTCLRALPLVMLMSAITLSCSVPVGPGWDTPDAPVLSTPADTSAAGITLSWSPYPGATGYHVHAGNTPQGPYTTLTKEPVTDEQLTVLPAQIFPRMFGFFTVSAVTTEGETAQSECVEGWIRPANLAVTDFTPGATPAESVLTIQWDSIPGITQYNVYYAYHPEGPFYQIGSELFVNTTLSGITVLSTGAGEQCTASFYRSRSADAWFRIQAVVYADGLYYYSRESELLKDEALP